MANEKLDWFPIYWQRFIIGTLEMNAEEIGAYFLLLIHQWDKGFIPEDHKELKKICRVSVKKLEKVLEKFQKVENDSKKLFNVTLEKIREEQTEKASRRSEAGKTAARSKNERRTIVTPTLSDRQPLEEKREEEKRIDKNRIEERENKHAPEIKFIYMIDAQEIYSVEETLQKNFMPLFTDLKLKHGELKIKKWVQEFSELHNQKSWKDLQDFRSHFSNFIRISSEKNNDRNKQNNTGAPKDGKVGAFGKL